MAKQPIYDLPFAKGIDSEENQCWAIPINVMKKAKECLEQPESMLETHFINLQFGSKTIELAFSLPSSQDMTRDELRAKKVDFAKKILPKYLIKDCRFSPDFAYDAVLNVVFSCRKLKGVEQPFFNLNEIELIYQSLLPLLREEGIRRDLNFRSAVAASGLRLK